MSSEPQFCTKNVFYLAFTEQNSSDNRKLNDVIFYVHLTIKYIFIQTYWKSSRAICEIQVKHSWFFVINVAMCVRIWPMEPNMHEFWLTYVVSFYMRDWDSK